MKDMSKSGKKKKLRANRSEDQLLDFAKPRFSRNMKGIGINFRNNTSSNLTPHEIERAPLPKTMKRYENNAPIDLGLMNPLLKV